MLSDRVVIVNSDLEFVKNIKMLFKEYEIIHFFEGKEFLSFFEKNKDVTLVFLNTALPDVDSFELLSRLKEKNKDIYAIMMSSSTTKDMVVKALRSHADDFWDIPVDIAEIKEKTQAVINSQRYNSIRSSREENVDRIKRFIKRNYSSATLDFISKELSLSSKYVSRMFNEKNGSCFRDYKIDIKIDKAKELLGNTSLSIKEVSSSLGYKKPESFMRIFKRITHKTPKQYRNELKV